MDHPYSALYDYYSGNPDIPPFQGKTVRSSRKLGIFDRSALAERAWAMRKWRPRCVVDAWQNELSGGTNPCSCAPSSEMNYYIFYHF